MNMFSSVHQCLLATLICALFSNLTLAQDQPTDQEKADRPQLELADDQASPSDQLELLAQEQDRKWPAKTIRDISLDIRDGAKMIPQDRSAELSGYGRQGAMVTTSKVFAWTAPEIRYQPLYFEDVALERYGQTLSPYKQSVVSNVHFFKSILTLPRQMRFDHPFSCDYPLGFCRPGNDTPLTYQRQVFRD